MTKDQAIEFALKHNARVFEVTPGHYIIADVTGNETIVGYDQSRLTEIPIREYASSPEDLALDAEAERETQRALAEMYAD